MEQTFIHEVVHCVDSVYNAATLTEAKIVAREAKSDAKSVAQKSLTLMTFYGIPLDQVWIDNFGQGANVAKEIALASGQRVNSLNVNEEVEDKERYVNRRAEAFLEAAAADAHRSGARAG